MQKRNRHRVQGSLLGWLLLIWLINSAWALERDEIVIASDEQEYRLNVEIARTVQERSFGLMERDQLAADAGMLFVYQEQQPPESGFWMHRTRIPLDIAFIGRNGEILAIDSMVPCGNDVTKRCPTYRAGVPFRAALEVNAGYFDARSIEVGDYIELP